MIRTMSLVPTADSDGVATHLARLAGTILRRAAMSKREFPSIPSARITHVDELASSPPATWSGKSVRVLAR